LPSLQAMTATRTATAVDRVADGYLDEWAALDPFVATEFGIAGHDGEVPDLSPDGLAEISALRQRTLRALSAARPVDAQDRITSAALAEVLTVEEELRAAGAEESNVRNIASPVQTARDSFDLMPTDSAEDWSVVATRLGRLPDALAGYIASLRLAASRGDVSARRQVQAAATQSARNVGPDGFFATLAASAPADLPAAVRADLDAGARAASAAYAELAEFLRTELLDQAPDVDAVGREKYALHSRSFLGATVDLEETYTWGQEELARLGAAMRATAERIRPGATVREVMAELDQDPARMLSSRDALVEWMQAKSDAAVAALADTHFDIPEPVRTLECRIATAGTGVVYYTGPSEDFTRPGRMWWDVPDGDDEFSTWRELTTVYHEGVPGHHLQIAQTIYRAELLNRWRRIASWVSGHGEGWALYAERLMADLGFLDDPAEYLGMLDGQSTRAARVVLDIGIHCGFDAPAEAGGGPWTYEKAWDYFGVHCAATESVRRFELERYLGWPGQAPSYKIGERLWLQLREDARAKQGDAFDLKSFHRAALDVGSVGLDVLRSAVLQPHREDFAR
jgi:uncharacterized protein (DUF885 family)